MKCIWAVLHRPGYELGERFAVNGKGGEGRNEQKERNRREAIKDILNKFLPMALPNSVFSSLQS